MSFVYDVLLGGEESNSDSDSDQEKQPSGKINSTAKK